MRKTVLLVSPLLALSACSGRDDAAEPRPARTMVPAQGAGPSLDGPMLATPGLWRTTTTVAGRRPFRANRTCVGAASQEADHMLSPPAETGCKSPARRPITGGYACELVCEKDGLKTLTSGEVKGDAKRVTMTSTASVIGPDGEASPPSGVMIESVYAGPCLTGMKSGDSVQEGVSAP
jgi:hypothetical protein